MKECWLEVTLIKMEIIAAKVSLKCYLYKAGGYIKYAVSIHIDAATKKKKKKKSGQRQNKQH